jgi:cytochrome c oxidase subunit 3
MHALPAAPEPAPRRQILVGTALLSAASAAVVGALLALWLRLRHEAINGVDGRWVPKGIRIPMVPANVMLISLVPLCIFAQWAVYSAKREDKPHAALALALVGVLGVAFVNAQAMIWGTLKLPAHEGSYSAMFYSLTGVTVLLAIVGICFSAAAAFRFLGGRTTERELVAAHALYWYAFSAVFALVWFVVYVTK